jgi:hypothetical protein
LAYLLPRCAKKYAKNGAVWCPQCGAEFVPEMTTCAECVVALVDEPPHDTETHDVVTYDLHDWEPGRLSLLRYQLESREVSWEEIGVGVFRVAAGSERVVDELIDDLSTGDAIDELPDAFILPDGRRVTELPIGPDVRSGDSGNPIEWVRQRSPLYRALEYVIERLIQPPR